MKKIYFRSVILVQLGMMLSIVLYEILPYGLSRYFDHLLSLLLSPAKGFVDSDNAVIAFTCLFILCLFWAVFLCFGILLIYKAKKKSLPQQSWRIISYPQKVLICQVVITIALAVTFLIQPYHRDIFLILFISALAGSYIIAFFWHTAKQLWSKSRVSSGAMGALGLVFFLLIPFGTFLILKISYNDDYTRSSDGSGIGVVSVDSDNDYDEYYGDEEDIGEWEGPVAEDRFIGETVKYMFDSMGYGGFPWDGFSLLTSPEFIENFDLSKEVDRRLLFANNLGLHINRENNKLLQFYNRYSDFIFERIPLKKYKEMSASNYVSLYISTYEECSNGYELNGYLMERIYRQAVDEQDWTWEKMNSLLAEYEISPVYDEENGADSERNRAYEFWGRRYNEGNHNAAYQILCSIKEHYSDSTEGN